MMLPLAIQLIWWIIRLLSTKHINPRYNTHSLAHSMSMLNRSEVCFNVSSYKNQKRNIVSQIIVFTLPSSFISNKQQQSKGGLYIVRTFLTAIKTWTTTEIRITFPTADFYFIYFSTSRYQSLINTMANRTKRKLLTDYLFHRPRNEPKRKLRSGIRVSTLACLCLHKNNMQ